MTILEITVGHCFRAREILWSVSKWKNNKLKEFIIDFNPDIIYMPVYDCFYTHNI